MKLKIVLLMCILISCAAASEQAKITVTSSGSAKVVPTGLQVWLTLKEKAPDAASAVQALKTQQDKVAAKLTELGIKSEPFKSELPGIVDKNAQNNFRQQRSGQRLKRKPAAEEKPEVEMQQMVRTVIPLTSKDPAALIVEAEMLKAKINGAKLIEEKAEGNDGDDENNMGFNPSGNQNASAINYVYFAPQNDEQHSAAIADALKKATESATRAAKAMGKAGVELHSLTMGPDAAEMANPYLQYRRYYGGQNNELPAQEDGITSPTPQLSVTAQLSAEFLLK